VRLIHNFGKLFRPTPAVHCDENAGEVDSRRDRSKESARGAARPTDQIW
jgi:hypothetical protein